MGSDSKYLLGILNSRLWTFMFSKVSSTIRGGFFRWKRQYMSPLPILSINLSDPNEKDLHDCMIALVDGTLALHKQLATVRAGYERTVIQRQIVATDRQIDNLVYELYGLTEDEIKIVDEALSPSNIPADLDPALSWPALIHLEAESAFSSYHPPSHLPPSYSFCLFLKKS